MEIVKLNQQLKNLTFYQQFYEWSGFYHRKNSSQVRKCVLAYISVSVLRGLVQLLDDQAKRSWIDDLEKMTPGINPMNGLQACVYKLVNTSVFEATCSCLCS